MITNIQVAFNTTTNQFDFTLVSDDGATSEWFIAISGPSGVVKVIDLLTPDLVSASSTVSIANPFASFAAGVYTFQVILHPDAVPGDAITEDNTFDYQPNKSIDYTLTHDGSTLTISDSTSYPSGITNFLRSSTLVYPGVSGVPGSADVVFTEANFSVSMALADGNIYENVTWNVSGTGSYDLSLTSGVWQFSHSVVLTGNGSLFVLIELDPCAIIPCVDDYWAALLDKSCSIGGLSNLSDTEADQLIEIMGNLTLYQYWIDCGDIDKARTYYNNILSSLGSTCSPTTTPRAVNTTPVASYGTWTDLEAGDYNDGFYVVVPSNPLSWRIVGGLMQWKGQVGVDANNVAGRTMVPASYWTAKGVTPTAFAFALLVDVDLTAPAGEGRVWFDALGNLIAAANGSIITLGHDFTICGQIPVE